MSTVDEVKARLDIVEELPDSVDPRAGPDDAALSAERQARVEELLQQLSPKKRAVLVMHDLRGMEAQRIAEILDTNILTVRTRLFYARRELEALANRHRIRWYWVRGHADNEGNLRADALANRGVPGR